MPSCSLEFNVSEQPNPAALAEKVAAALAVAGVLESGDTVATLGGAETFAISGTVDSDYVEIVYRKRVYVGGGA